MNILWVSNSPLQPTGYGQLTKNLLPKVNERTDHNFTVYAMSGIENSTPIQWRDDIELHGKSGDPGAHGWKDINRLYNQLDIDLVFFAMDAWIYAGQMQQGVDFPFMCYSPIDHDPLPNKWRVVAEESVAMIPYCRFGQHMLEEAGYEEKTTDYVYHGVDRNIFHEDESVGSEELGFDEDKFVVTIAKANQGSRTQYPKMLEGFRRFIDQSDEAKDDARLYIHTDERSSDGYNLVEVLTDLGISQYTKMPVRSMYLHGMYDDEMMAEAFQATDLLLNTVAGEGFGLPILEAMSTGTPVVGTKFSSMPELLGIDEYWEHPYAQMKGGEVDRGWLANAESMVTTPIKSSKRAVPDAEQIQESLESAYRMWKGKTDAEADRWQEMKENCIEFAERHNWDMKADDMVEQIEEVIDLEQEVHDGYGPIYFAKRQVDRTEFEVFHDKLKSMDGNKVLDAGCGTGELMEHLSDRGYQVSGLDTSSYAVQKAKDKGLDDVYSSKIENVKDFFGENQFNAVTVQHLLEHVEDDVEVLEDLLDIAEEKVVVISPTPVHKQITEEPDETHERYYGQEEIERLKDELDNEKYIVNSHPEGDPAIDVCIEIIHTEVEPTNA